MAERLAAMGVGPTNRFGHTSQVTPASRNRCLTWAAVACVLFGVLAILVTRDRAPLDAFDIEGRGLEDWADGYSVLVDVLRVIEVAFGTIGMTVLTVVLALALVVRRQRWAALLDRRGDGRDLARHDRRSRSGWAATGRAGRTPSASTRPTASPPGTPRPWRRTPRSW